MDEEIAECFKRIITNRKKVKVEPMIDGVCGFLFLDIMGHGDIGVTLNTYTHVGFEDVKKEMKRLKDA